MAKNKKEVANLDGASESELMAIFKKIFPKVKDVATLSLDRIKQRIRVHYANKGITEKPIVAIATVNKKDNKNRVKVVKKANFSFDYRFTEFELQEKGKQLARTSALKSAIEDEKKSAMSNFKDRLDSTQSEINILSRNINEGSEYVTRTYEAEHDYDKATITYFFEGIKVGSAKMSQADFQMEAEFSE